MSLYNSLAQFAGKKLPRPLFNIALRIGETYKHIVMPEQKKSYGDLNPDKTFYVIRLYSPAGYLACYNFVLGYMKKAFSKGWIPIIDMENYETMYQMKEAVNGTRNVWEYIFKQPYDTATGKRYSLDEVYHSKNVILSDGSELLNDLTGDFKTLEWQHEMAELVPFQDIVQEKADTILNRLFTSERVLDGILGGRVRGTDLKTRVIGHAIQADGAEIAADLKRYSKEWNCKNIFVVAEEEGALKELDAQGITYICTETDRVKETKKNTNAAYQHNTDAYSNLVDYCVNVYLLSRCNALIGTMNNGMYTAMIWNGNKYEHLEIIDKGRYK